MVTMKELAQRLGCAESTVSRALAGHPRISPATRQRVLRVARQVGYRPDPRLAALVGRRWPGGRRTDQAVLACGLDAYTAASRRKLAEGAARAAELGYRLEELRLDRLDDPAGLQENLIARGVRGLLIDLHDTRWLPPFDWSRFCVVVLGEELAGLPFHRVGTDWRQAMRLAVRHAQLSGARRMGFCLGPLVGRGLYESLLGEMLSAAWRAQPGPEALEAVFAPDSADRRDDYLRWLDRCRPDAVIASFSELWQWTPPGQATLIALIQPDAPPPPGRPGIDIRRGHRLRIAIDLLHDLLRLDRRGQSSDPQTILCQGVWTAPGAQALAAPAPPQ